MGKLYDVEIKTDKLIKKKWNNRQVIDWKNNSNKEIEFKYKSLYSGKIKIIDVINKNGVTLILQYNNIIKEMKPYDLLYGHIGSLINVRTHDFKYNIGDVVNNPNRSMTIKDRYKVKYKTQYKKYYSVICNDCKSEYEIEESDFTGQNVNNRCKHCLIKNNKNNKNNKEYKEKYSNSYPERVMITILNTLQIKFKKEYSPKWCNKKRYDFYFELNGEKYIIETHGLQHYKENTNFKMSLEEEQQNDKYKYNLAVKNGIKPKNYIIIDCRYSKLEYIKNNILHSRLNEIFNLNDIDWNEIEKESLSKTYENIVKDFDNNKDNDNIIEILSLKYCLTKETIEKILLKYSKKYDGMHVYSMCLNNNMCFSTLIDICNYFDLKMSNVSQAISNNGVAFSKKYNTYIAFKKITKEEYLKNKNKYYDDLIYFNKGKCVRVYDKNNNYIKSFPSLNALCECFKDKLEISGVRYQINNSKKDYKGYIFELISKEEYLEDINRL